MKNLLTSASLLALCALPASAQETYYLGEIVFSAASVPTETYRTGVSVDVLDNDALKSGGASSLNDALHSVVGLNTNQNGPFGATSNIIIRGSDKRYVASYVDGIRVNDPSAVNGAFDGFGTLPAFGLTRVEVLKGSQSALYGGAAVAGAINISTLPDPVEQGTKQTYSAMGGSYGTIAGSYTLSQKVDALALRFASSYLKTNGFSSADENDGNTETDGASSKLVSADVSYALSDNLTIGLFGTTSQSKTDFDKQGPFDSLDSTSFNDSVALRAYAEYSAAGWDNKLSISRRTVDRESKTPGSFHSIFASERTVIDAQASKELSDRLRLTLGAQRQVEDVTTESISSATDKVTSNAIFGEAFFAPDDITDVTLSMRREHSSSFGGINTGRLAGVRRLDSGISIRGAISNGYRAPTFGDLFGVFDETYQDFDYSVEPETPELDGNGNPTYTRYRTDGNPNLKPETANSYELGFDANYSAATKFSFTAFQTEIKDRIEYYDVNSTTVVGPSDTTTTDFSSYRNDSGVSVRKGFEISGTHALSDTANLQGNYSYVDARDASGDALSRVPRHTLEVGIETAISDKWATTWNARFIAGRPDDSDPQANYVVVNGNFNYTISDDAQAFLRIENVLNEEYQTINGYGTSDRAVYFGIRGEF